MHITYPNYIPVCARNPSIHFCTHFTSLSATPIETTCQVRHFRKVAPGKMQYQGEPISSHPGNRRKKLGDIFFPSRRIEVLANQIKCQHICSKQMQLEIIEPRVDEETPLEIVDCTLRVSLSQICCNSCSRQPGLARTSSQSKAAVHSSVVFGIFKTK